MSQLPISKFDAGKYVREHGTGEKPVSYAGMSRYAPAGNKGFDAYLRRMAHGYGLALGQADESYLKKGYRQATKEEFERLHDIASYNYQTGKNYDFGGLDYNPWENAEDKNDAYASYYSKYNKKPTTNDLDKYYTVNYKYKDQYGNTAEDLAAYKAGQAPMRVQYGDKLIDQYNALAGAYNAGNLSYEKARELAPDLYALTGYAKEQEAARARAEGKAQAASYPSQGTKQSVNVDWLDPEVLKLLGYDEKTGFAKLFEGLPQTQVDIMEAQMMPSIQQKAANARRLPQAVQDGRQSGGRQSPAATGNTKQDIRSLDYWLNPEILNPEFWEKAANQTTNTLKWTESPTDGGGSAYVSDVGKEGKRYVIVPTQDGRYALMWMSDNETSFEDYKGQIELFSNPNYAKWSADQYRKQIDAGVKPEDVDAKERAFLWVDRYIAWKKDPLRNPFPGGYVSKGDENTWWGKLWEGNAFGGVTGVLSIPQELYLNAWNMGMQAGKGEKIQARPGMTNRDYMRENAERFGGTDLGAELDKAGALGAIANFSLEILTDPTNFLPGGLVYDALRARGLANPKNLRYVQEFTNEKVLGQRYNPVSDDARGLVHPQITADDVKLAEAQNSEYARLNAAKNAPEITPTVPNTRQAGSLDELFPPAARPEVTMSGTGTDMPRLPARVDDPNLPILGGKPTTTISPRTSFIDTPAPAARNAVPDGFTKGLSSGMGELDGGFTAVRRTPDTTAVLEAARDVKKPYVAAMENADNALIEAKGFDTPEAARAWAEGTDGASVYKVTGRDAGGKVKALEPVQTEAGRLHAFPESGISGDDLGNMLRGVPDETGTVGKAATAATADNAEGFVKGLDEGMGGLPEPKNAGPETIDFSAEGGKARGGRENIRVTDWVGKEGAGDKPDIPKARVDEILKTPKYSRPDPTTYLRKEYITNHATQFKNGVTKISYQAPSGYAGPPGGTFVMPTSVADNLIARADGDIAELERLLGLNPGDLGTNPVRIDIANPTGLRMPSGNEKGANSKWIPGGYTSGGIPEIIIDSPGPEQYTIRPIK